MFDEWIVSDVPDTFSPGFVFENGVFFIINVFRTKLVFGIKGVYACSEAIYFLKHLTKIPDQSNILKSKKALEDVQIPGPITKA